MSGKKRQEKPSDKEMGQALITFAGLVAAEKSLAEAIVYDAIAQALESATKKKQGAEIHVRVQLDQLTGHFQTYRRWEVVAIEDLEDPELQLSLADAQAKQADIEIGQFIEESMPSVEFGRIPAQAAKQVIQQKVREAERELVVQEYSDKIKTLVRGTVKKTTRDNLIIDLGGKAEALLPRRKLLPNDVFRPGDMVRALLSEVQDQQRGPQLLVSRTDPEMLLELFKTEVPEIAEGIIEVKSVARDPGFRAKLAVLSKDGRIDPVGACVGMRGSRVQAVSSELGGERVDIVPWDSNPAQFVINAMAPAEVNSIVVDEETHTMDLAVEQDNLSQAIGRGGQNINLASKLTGWILNVMTDQEFSEKSAEESQEAMQMMMAQLGLEQEVAELLVEAGFSTLEEIAYVPKEELAQIGDFDDEIIEELRNRANDILLTQALVTEEELSNKEPAEDLLALEGMDKALAYQLANQGIVTREDLAEQSVDDLLDIEGMEAERAGELIMKARAHWFTDEES